MRDSASMDDRTIEVGKKYQITHSDGYCGITDGEVIVIGIYEIGDTVQVYMENRDATIDAETSMFDTVDKELMSDYEADLYEKITMGEYVGYAYPMGEETYIQCIPLYLFIKYTTDI